MSMPVEAKDIAVGDWSPAYGTVTKVTPHENQGKVTTITIEFFDGKSIMCKPDQQEEIVQDGSQLIHNGMPDPSEIRPGLKEDHAKD